MPPYVFIRQELKVRGKRIVRISGNDSQNGKAGLGRALPRHHEAENQSRKHAAPWKSGASAPRNPPKINRASAPVADAPAPINPPVKLLMAETTSSAHLQITRVTLSRVFNGKAGISAAMAIRLAAAIGHHT
jgi:hypothetical protein